jgi:hypothetical protein
MIIPVWNKSRREHEIIGTEPQDVRREADAAVRACGWKGPYFVDADHIGMGNVDAFIPSSDFFTLDVADAIGEKAPEESIRNFISQHRSLVGSHSLPGLENPLVVTGEDLTAAVKTYLFAVEEAGRIYRHIRERRKDPFIVEVSMDETETPQTPGELLVILAAIAWLRIPVRTVAPRFSGRFNKGVDYVGDIARFKLEFEQDVSVIRYAVEMLPLPGDLKLSVHSGSDKFSIYRPMGEILRKHKAGLHLKTAGTTWLEELIGLAEAGGDGLDLARQIYREAYDRREELCLPYSTVIDIHEEQLPEPDVVAHWVGEEYTAALRHDPANQEYNRNFRQLLHVAYKVAAEMGDRFLRALDRHRESIARNVTENLMERHIRKLFI